MFTAPYPPYDPTDKSGFSYETVVKRWPIIITGVIDTVYRLNHDMAVEAEEASDGKVDNETQEKINEGKKIIEEASRLKYKMARDHELEPIPDDGEHLVEVYNAELNRLRPDGRGTWFTAPWLFAECYLYRLIRAFISQRPKWREFDPFAFQKMETFRKSGDAVLKIATIMHDISQERDALFSDPDKIGVLFEEMLQMCLWGNATDLSLLTTISEADIAHLQSVGRDAQESRKEFVLRNDVKKAWEQLKQSGANRKARIDFVLDNSGFELFTDFVFADFLVTYTPYVSRVIFHPKLIPWFVSDVTPKDFAETLDILFHNMNKDFFTGLKPEEDQQNAEKLDQLNAMVNRWKQYIADGVFALSVPTDTPLGGYRGQGTPSASVKGAEFWTTPWPYWDMQTLAPELWSDLNVNSGLVILKGDLNYRKLAGDIKWPSETEFTTAIGPLSGSFPILSLRTNKADVVVGVDAAVAQKLQQETGNAWRTNGRYALVSFAPKKD